LCQNVRGTDLHSLAAHVNVKFVIPEFGL
jgi:hypothetical protein